MSPSPDTPKGTPRIVQLGQIIELRKRRHPQLKDGRFEDESADALHVATFVAGQEGPICCVSFYPTAGTAAPFRCRGISTDESHEGHGYARDLLLFGMKTIVEMKSVRSFITFAREKTVGFYEESGWTATGKTQTHPKLGTLHEMTTTI